MSLGSRKRTRSEHVASLEFPPGTLGRLFRHAQRGDVQLRLLLCGLATLATFLITEGWKPPFPYRAGYVPPRHIVARVSFEVTDEQATAEKTAQVRNSIRYVYQNNSNRLAQLREALGNTATQIVSAKSAEEVSQAVWNDFWPPGDQGADAVEVSPQERDAFFAALHAALAGESDREAFHAALERAFSEFEKDGLLNEQDIPPAGQGDQVVIEIHPPGSSDKSDHRPVEIEKVRLLEARGRLAQRAVDELGLALPDEPARDLIGERVAAWVTGKVTATLQLDADATEEARDAAGKSVAAIKKRYGPGDQHTPPDVLAKGGQPIERDSAEDRLLRQEYQQVLANMTPLQTLTYALANLGMYLAVYTLCGLYVFFRERRLLTDLGRYCTLLVLAVLTVALCWIGSRDSWRVEIIPLLLFGMTMTVAYRQEMALLLSTAASLVVVLSLGQGLDAFVVLVAVSAVMIQLMGRIRSRTKLITIGMVGAMVAGLTALGTGVVMGQPFPALLPYSLWTSACTILAAVLMTGLLPFVERLFNVQTDLKLLELGDAAHPLLQELVRRAPGTYNHSINVASIAEAAAEEIGANGLLVRVGAYFHDIGKMLKPEYFIENQGPQASRHESLVPAMSTLVIIAHVKDGADLARQHGLPNSVVDFVLQHHGTTLVEFFYDQAHQKSKQDPNSTGVDESTFRYPGPKPQTKEAGVMMLADAVEGASRTLVDPAPKRIRSLVQDIAMKRLVDGQFDECGLTFRELQTIEDALVKSLTAVYHGRVKYPDQQESA
jgi:putative nucleotidyltransferase with HDIG domain